MKGSADSEDKMDIRQIDDNYSVSGQISPDDVRDIAAEGFQTIICNRPDGEGGPEQPDFAEIARVAEKAGLATYYIPVVGGQLTQDDVHAMAAALDEAEGPFFAYCRSGARSTNIYGIVQSQKRG
ncbi:FAD-dependent pyridine nucleotide-disulphide oxidoreductase [Ochrobactrum soli]|uniref:FAD-dependent pyridine nucleotide-disulphide oxidoreductase n=2 Tax=Brucellaceae TaxID=118882 RepID=A0A2P9HGN3_9HYPH|nr:FAD-dependent pyridine nucleotide-disulphide oxidoreductase [[Ochrobactrum] soli]